MSNLSFLFKYNNLCVLLILRRISKLPFCTIAQILFKFILHYNIFQQASSHAQFGFRKHHCFHHLSATAQPSFEAYFVVVVYKFNSSTMPSGLHLILQLCKARFSWLLKF